MTSKIPTPTPTPTPTQIYELPLGQDVEELGLGLTKMRVIISEIGSKLLLYNARKKPFEVPYYTKDHQKTVDGARQELIDSDEFDHKRKELEIFATLLSDRLLELKQKLASGQPPPTSEDEDIESDREKKSYYLIHKYTTDTNLAEAILIGSKPMFLQIIDGKAQLSKEIPLPDSNIVLRPLDKWSYLSKEYSFSSEEEINTCIKRAKEETVDSLYNKDKSM
jgi:hypothetical protein